VSKLRFDSMDLAKSFPLDVKRVALRWRRFSQPLSAKFSRSRDWFRRTYAANFLAKHTLSQL